MELITLYSQQCIKNNPSRSESNPRIRDIDFRQETTSQESKVGSCATTYRSYVMSTNRYEHVDSSCLVRGVVGPLLLEASDNPQHHTSRLD
jgi:hypothetical protein